MADRREEVVRGMARKEFSGHVMQETPVRSYSFKRANGAGAYAFTLTWTPGRVDLSGDVGQLAIVHGRALRSFDEGMLWLTRCDYPYLMDKAEPAGEEFDLDGTYDFLCEWAAEPALHDLRHMLRERRRERADRAQGHREWAGAREAWEASADPRPEDEPKLEDFLPDPGYYDPPLRITARSPKAWAIGSEPAFDVPDGFRNWHRLWRVLQDVAYVGRDPNVVFTAKGRRAIRLALKVRLRAGGQDGAAKLCLALEMRDYFGSTKYPERTVWQVEAIQHGAGMIVDELGLAETRAA